MVIVWTFVKKLEEQIRTSTAKYPHTAVMRNFFATASNLSLRQTEWQKTETIYCFGLQLFFRREGGSPRCLFCVDKSGIKNLTIEACFKELFEWLLKQYSSMRFVVQGPEDSIAEEAKGGDKEENVIITAPEEEAAVKQVKVESVDLLKWSNTEKYYDFSQDVGSIMNRWFPMDSILINTSYTPDRTGGLVKSWKIPQDLISGDFNAVNVLPLRSFMLGKLDIEFKIVVQANPFQACCVMLSTMPNPYGIQNKFYNWSGIKNNGSTGSGLKTWPYSYTANSAYTYADRDVAVQRPNTIVDVRTGGFGTLRVDQKYHKTLIRNFDSSFVDNLNPGIRGAWSSNLLLHVLTQLRVGQGSDPNFNVRVFYRFIGTKVTAMTEAVTNGSTSVTTMRKMTTDEYNQYMKPRREPVQPNQDKTTQQNEANYKSQGGMLSTARTALDVADTTINVLENIGTNGRRGMIATLNRDKPNDVISTVRVTPRPRNCFGNGVGSDDAVVMAISWNELVDFFEEFQQEPKNFIEFMAIKGILTSFTWSKSQKANDELFSWNAIPTLKNYMKDDTLDTNSLRTPLGVACSAFTNYWGTIELCFQFVKTDFHKGSVEVSIQFGKKVDGDSLKSTYVKILNVQECSAFKVTIPYIYDTPVRSIAGTSTPLMMPNLTNPDFIKFYNSTLVKVKVLNELTCPTTVTSTIDVLVWMKAGRDFGVNFPHAMNTGTFLVGSDAQILLGASNVRDIFASNEPPKQYSYNLNNGSITTIGSNLYVTQGFETQGDDDDDFNQGEYFENKITSAPHTNFADLLKMPIKILSAFELPNQISRTYTSEGTSKTYDLQNYFMLPVAPLSYSLIEYLNSQWFNGKADVANKNATIFGNCNLQQSIQCQINAMFSMYRGSFIITIVLHEATKPVYCCYLPHDYSLRPLTGNLNVNQPLFNSGNYYATAQETAIGMGNDTYVDLSMAFPGTQMIIKDINPTERFLIPMSTQCNWLLMNRSLGAKSNKVGLITYRENQEWYNGHFALWSQGNVTMDVFISAGDDHKLGGFLGHHGIVNPWAQFSLTDNWRVQGLDFNLKEITQNGWNSVKTLSKYTLASTVATFAYSLVPPELRPIVAGTATFSILGGINEVLQLKNIVCEAKPIVAQIENLMNTETIVEDSSRLIINILKESFPMLVVTPTMVDQLWSAAQHLVHSALAMNWKNAAFGVFCMMVKLELFSISDWKLIGEKVSNYFSSFGINEYVSQGETSEDVWVSMCEAIALVFCAKMQVNGTKGLKNYLMELFQYQNYKNVSGLNAMMSLVRNTIRSVTNIFNWLLQRKDPNVVLTQLLHKQGSEISLFVEEANSYLNHFNDKDIKRKQMRIRYLTVIIQAYKLREVLLQIGNPRLSQHLLVLCNDVIKKAVRQRYLFQCDIVKSEPFILCVSGASNLGKSFSVYDLAADGLNKINVPVTNPDFVFLVAAGVDYWNGYDDQPVIWYDDWCNLLDEQTMRSHISQLYALKTSAPFNVPRAELDNKEQIASPNIVIMTTNNPFPKHPMIQFEEAVYRRRDMVVQFALKGDCTNINQFTQEQISKYEHLEVRIYNDVKDASTLGEQVYSYEEFKEIYKKNLLQFHLNEMNNKKIKYDTLMRTVTQTQLDQIDLGNPFEMISKLNEEDLLTKNTSEVLEDQVILLHNLLQDHLNILKLKVNDEQIFKTQGLYDSKGDQEHVFFKATSTQKESEKEAHKGFMDTFFGRLTKWYNTIKHLGMICERCGLSSNSQGTGFWCQEHDHYLCFNCGTVNARPYMIEKQTGDTYLDLSCPLHFTNIIVRRNGYSFGLIADFINFIAFQPIYIIKHWMQQSQSEESKVILFTFMVKAVISRLIYLLINKACDLKKLKPGSWCVQGSETDLEGMSDLFTEGVEEINDQFGPTTIQRRKIDRERIIRDFCSETNVKTQHNASQVTIEDIGPEEYYDSTVEIEELDYNQFNGPISVGAYGKHCMEDIDNDLVKQCKEFFESTLILTGDNELNKLAWNFICPHSVLVHEYVYFDKNFHLAIPDTTRNLIIPDKLCKSKCALTNERFLNLIKTKLMLSTQVLKDYKDMKIDTIMDRFPRFTHTPDIVRASNRRQWVKQLIRRDWWENYIVPVKDASWKFIKKCLPIVAACGAIWLANKSFAKIWSWIAKLLGIESQGLISSGATPTKTRRNVRTKRVPSAFQTQASTENFDNKLSKVSKNFICIEVNGKKLTAWGLQNTTFLIPKHLGKYLQNAKHFQIKFFSQVIRTLDILTINCSFTEFPDQDLMQVLVNGVAPMFVDCAKFVSAEQSYSYTKGKMLIADVRSMEIYEEEVRILNVSNNFTALDGATEVFSRRVVMYDLEEKGMCGSLLCVDSNNPVYAMHIAGSTSSGRGVGIPLDLNRYNVQGSMEELEDTGEHLNFYGEDCLIDYVGSVERNLVPFIPNKSTIHPSLIADLLDAPVTRPAFLSMAEKDYPFEKPPLYYGIRKNGFPTIDFPMSYVERAFERVSALVLSGHKIRTPTILTIEESVCGLPKMCVMDKYNDDEDVIYYGSLPLDTSAGFPYSTVQYREKYNISKTNKEGWIKIVYEDSYPSSCEIHAKVLEDHDYKMNLRKQGVLPLNIFQDCLKDERRPLKKVFSEGGTRLFSMSNIEGSIALRRYTLDLTSHLRYNRIRNGIAVGINPESMEWSILAETLARHPNYFTTDFSNFGAGLNYACGMQFAGLINAYYAKFGTALNPVDQRVVQVLIQELMASKHIAGNLVYGTFAGSPSGAAITVEINSVVHLLYITLAWMIIGDVYKSECGFDPVYFQDLACEYVELRQYLCANTPLDRNLAKNFTLDDLNNNVVNVVYGDDGLFSVSDEYVKLFNALTINLVLKDHGIGVTDASKQEHIVPYGPLESVSFLKRRFVPHPLLPNSLFMAQMSLDTVYECPKWIHKNELGDEVNTLENCQSALMLCFGHGERFYERYRTKLNDALEAKGLKRIHMSWMDLCMKFYPELLVG